MRAYLAGPLGFSEAGRSFLYDKLIPALTKVGVEVVDPWSLTDPVAVKGAHDLPAGARKQLAWRALNAVIARTNVEAIDSCGLVIAVLDGADVDSGTAAEIGYAFARGKRIVGYRGDFRLAGDNEGATVNLQVEYFIDASGGEIVRSLDILADLAASSPT
jgi:nucleoside 2-deoxyribosyltransferase